MSRTLTLLFGLISYALAMAAIVYGVGFIGNFWVPKSIDSGAVGPALMSVVINLALLGLFAIQHSVMARSSFKSAWTKIVPEPIERSTYVLFSALALILLYAFWQPIPGDVWRVENDLGVLVLHAVYFLGWGIFVASTFILNHGELFGLQQVAAHWRG